jgi:hypothetical protein
MNLPVLPESIKAHRRPYRDVSFINLNCIAPPKRPFQSASLLSLVTLHSIQNPRLDNRPIWEHDCEIPVVAIRLSESDEPKPGWRDAKFAGDYLEIFFIIKSQRPADSLVGWVRLINRRRDVDNICFKGKYISVCSSRSNSAA